MGYAQWLAQLVNICLQALLLTVSLLSIAYQRNVFPVWIGIAVAVGGVVLLAVTGLGMLAARQLAAAQLASIAGRIQMAVGPPDSGVPGEKPRPTYRQELQARSACPPTRIIRGGGGSSARREYTKKSMCVLTAEFALVGRG